MYVLQINSKKEKKRDIEPEDEFDIGETSLRPKSLKFKFELSSNFVSTQPGLINSLFEPMQPVMIMNETRDHISSIAGAFINEDNNTELQLHFYQAVSTKK